MKTFSFFVLSIIAVSVPLKTFAEKNNPLDNSVMINPYDFFDKKDISLMDNDFDSIQNDNHPTLYTYKEDALKERQAFWKKYLDEEALSRVNHFKTIELFEKHNPQLDHQDSKLPHMREELETMLQVPFEEKFSSWKLFKYCLNGAKDISISLANIALIYTVTRWLETRIPQLGTAVSVAGGVTAHRITNMAKAGINKITPPAVGRAMGEINQFATTSTNQIGNWFNTWKSDIPQNPNLRRPQERLDTIPEDSTIPSSSGQQRRPTPLQKFPYPQPNINPANSYFNPMSSQAMMQTALYTKVTNDLIGQLTNGAENILTGKAFTEMFSHESEKLNNVFKNLQTQYASTIKENLSKDMQNAIASIDTEINRLLQGYQNYGNIQEKGQISPDSVNRIKKLLQYRQEIFLSLPHEVKNIIGFGTATKEERLKAKAEINMKVHALIETYPAANQGPFDAFIERIIANSNPRLKSGRNKAAFFYGLNGVGKTRFVHALGKITGLYICEIKKNQSNGNNKIPLDKILSGYSASMFQNYDAFTESSEKISREDVIGALASCSIKAGHTNFIAFIDEFLDEDSNASRSERAYYEQKSLETYLKDLLDQKISHTIIPSLQIALPIDRITFIFAANYRIHDKGVKDRTDAFYFGALDKNQKEKIIISNIYSSMRELGEMQKDINEYNPAFLSHLEETLLSLKEELLEQDALVGEPGARALIDWIHSLTLKATNLDEYDQPVTKEILYEHLKMLAAQRRIDSNKVVMPDSY